MFAALSSISSACQRRSHSSGESPVSRSKVARNSSSVVFRTLIAGGVNRVCKWRLWGVKAPSNPSPSPLEVIEADESVAVVDDHPDGVEADGVRPRPRGVRAVQPRRRQASQAGALAGAQPGKRLLLGIQAPASPGAAGLDLDEDQGVAVERDEVDLAVAGAGVALDDGEPEALEVLAGEALAEASQRAPGVNRRGAGRRAGRAVGAGWVAGHEVHAIEGYADKCLLRVSFVSGLCQFPGRRPIGTAKGSVAARTRVTEGRRRDPNHRRDQVTPGSAGREPRAR